MKEIEAEVEANPNRNIEPSNTKSSIASLLKDYGRLRLAMEEVARYGISNRFNISFHFGWFDISVNFSP